MLSNFHDPTAVAGRPAQLIYEWDLWSKHHRNNRFHDLGTHRKCHGAITIVAKKPGVSHDTMLTYLSHWEVMEYFGGEKTSYFAIIQVVEILSLFKVIYYCRNTFIFIQVL